MNVSLLCIIHYNIFMSKYQNYFKHVGEHIVDNTKYDVYQPYGYALVLKSKIGRVLASVQVFYDDEDHLTQKCPILVPFEEGFQIIFQSEDSDSRIESGRPIKYIISNHCKEAGYVKIDLGYNKIPSQVTDPTENINNVNELRSFESVEIKSNQLDGWKQLMIKSKKKKNLDETITTVNLQEEVDTAPEEKVGTYLYLTVTPQKNCFLSDHFKESYWSPEDLIIVEKNYAIDNHRRGGEQRHDLVIVHAHNNGANAIHELNVPRPLLGKTVEQVVILTDVEKQTKIDTPKTSLSLFSKLFSKKLTTKNEVFPDETHVLSNLQSKNITHDDEKSKSKSKSGGFNLTKIFSKFANPDSQQLNHNNNFKKKSGAVIRNIHTAKTMTQTTNYDLSNDETDIYTEHITKINNIEQRANSSNSDFEDGDSSDLESEFYKRKCTINVIQAPVSTTVSNECQNMFVASNAQKNTKQQSEHKKVIIQEETTTFDQVEKTINSSIMKSKVAELIGGDKIIQQNGNKTHVSYDFSVRTEPRKIGLSIMDLAITKNYPDITADEIKNLVKSYLDVIKRSKDMEFVEFAKSVKKYRSDICAVCLDEDSPPGIVLIRCGHVCTCSDECTDILNNKCPMCQTQILCRINEKVLRSIC